MSRTTPTFLDVMVAFFGGLTGILAGSRKEKSNVIPGVAIATALMPPSVRLAMDWRTSMRPTSSARFTSF